jgi:hypothetical protein
MTVDRQGSAWVVSNGLLFKASTSDASCAAVPTWASQTAFPDFALTFAGTTTAVDHTLYILGDSLLGGGTLGTFDTASGAVNVVGPVQVPTGRGDMTSSGDGTLSFLMQSSMLTLYKLNPKNGAVIQSYALAASGGGSQALAFWGGSFYAFENGAINRYDPKTNATVALGNAPLQITGAGQSTCVPTTPPPAK